MLYNAIPMCMKIGLERPRGIDDEDEIEDEDDRYIKAGLSKLTTAEEKIACLDQEIEKELSKLTKEERMEVLWIVSNGRYGYPTKQD